MSNRRSRFVPAPSLISERPLCQTRTEPQLKRAQRRSAPAEQSLPCPRCGVSGASGQAPASSRSWTHRAHTRRPHSQATEPAAWEWGLSRETRLAHPPLITHGSREHLSYIDSSQNQKPRHAGACVPANHAQVTGEPWPARRLHAGLHAQATSLHSLGPEAGPDLSALSRGPASTEQPTPATSHPGN